MKLTFIRPSGTIREAPTTDDLPPFVVISGPNGSGKSNLLAAISDGSLAIPGAAPNPYAQPQQGIRQFRLAELAPLSEGAQSATSFRARYVQAYQQLDSYRQSVMQHTSGIAESAWAETLHRVAIENRWITQAALERIIERSGRSILEVQLEDFREHHPLIDGVRDPFTITATEIFLSYHDRYNQNRLEQWRVEQGDQGLAPLTQEHFFANYGPPPWKLLDETLALIGLQYEFVPPVGTEDSLSYIAQLKHLATGDCVTTDQLSSGEKTLLTVALTLFTGERLDRSIEMPTVLLLDEADASLHPLMIRSLVSVLVELFCHRYGVSVILTTHSPTTVALAPEESLYIMRRNENPRLVKASRDEALASLVVGLPTLSVSIDNRRQVFVESEDDESCYQALYGLVRNYLDSPFSLHFIASGRGGQGNSDAVVRLVGMLREAGNDRVHGVLDRDSRSGAPTGIVYSPHRYAIENLILDPLAVGVYLLRQGIITGADVGDETLRHHHVGPATAQAIVALVTRQVLGDVPLDAEISYLGGFTCHASADWMNQQGHGLEEKIRDAYKPLNRDGKALKQHVITFALGDVPGCTPQHAVDLLKDLLAAP